MELDAQEMDEVDINKDKLSTETSQVGDLLRFMPTCQHISGKLDINVPHVVYEMVWGIW